MPSRSPRVMVVKSALLFLTVLSFPAAEGERTTPSAPEADSGAGRASDGLVVKRSNEPGLEDSSANATNRTSRFSGSLDSAPAANLVSGGMAVFGSSARGNSTDNDSEDEHEE